MFPSGINPNGVNPGWGLGIGSNSITIIKLVIYCPPVLTFLVLNPIQIEIDALETIHMSIDKIESIINIEVTQLNSNLHLDTEQLNPINLSVGICDHA